MLSGHHQHSAATTSFNLRAETLLGQDQRICSSLEEKLQLYAELTDLTLNSPEAVPHRHLLVQPDTDSEVPKQASSLLTAALREGKKKCCFVAVLWVYVAVVVLFLTNICFFCSGEPDHHSAGSRWPFCTKSQLSCSRPRGLQLQQPRQQHAGLSV